ncbi:MAG TPA: glycosyltransferase [Candidatus Fournierella merdavium]|uniref:glycosyltransferase family 2 protein n=1 Tax=Candidatus Allofournierella merdavium TaxID=2838593 RepID=UPI001F86B83F|nr:glycosyltransferase [Candidatus Fournierella merdavium]
MTMTRPLITVVVLVYNAGAYLAPCLESISRQTLTDFELLLVDNGSTDGSAEACDAFARENQRCTVIHQENLGIIGGRGAGVQAAKGEYLAFVDSDDLLHRRMLEELAASCRSTGLPVACCRFLPFLGEQPPEVPDEPQARLRFEAPLHLDALLHDKRVEYSLCNKLYHRSLFEGFDFSSPVIYNEDLYLNWHILQRVKGMAFVDLVGYFYRQHAASTTHRPLHRRALEDQLSVASTILNEAKDSALEPTARAFYYEKLLYLDSMILRQENARDFSADHRFLLAQLRQGLRRALTLPRLPGKMKVVALVACMGGPFYRWLCRLLLTDRR